ncbi:protein NETWORKED 1D [Dorcoceras hygrometricum]|uniref:Protein NETWORKED 1D n=1 Tax=Dorcoceras hygrometricum TaxID=472368 RepID=A0A2Z7AXI5_9LAMI|nr:protein NETWORKED 1D [Dorcoceras hygrometricum]
MRSVVANHGPGSNPSLTSKNPPPTLNTLSSVSMRESRIQYLCDPQWFRDTANRGPTTIVAPESQFRTCPSDHDIAFSARLSEEATRVSQRFGRLTINFSRCVCVERSADGLRAADRYDGVGVTYYLLLISRRANDSVEKRRRLSVEMRRRFENFARSADGLFCLRELLSADICFGVVLFVELIEFILFARIMNFVSEKSNAIVGVVTTGFECLPPSCDGLTGPDDHGPMISTG